ncbi:glutamyl-tRNA reductase [Halosegnis marinus]|uniref:Glutamyl-tRNA reductase n=1 Tax=Halosegnis marinus TaxID=3034023 RepID=A0ABD5ZLM7_9EURY|nr:glutamyl-tRNA reductase [Halosegnis sp. DT85]
MTGATIISGLSVSHTDASVDEIEAACGESEAAVVADLLANPAVEEAFALQTCNRAEAYVVTADEADGIELLRERFAATDGDALRELDHEASLRHLMRVACGLESLVVGEDQILGQLRAAYETADEAGGVGPTLEDALLKAIHVGERARTETAINEGVVSLGSAAVELAARERDLSGATGLVVGAGEMGTLAAKALDDAVGRVIVANRTHDRARLVVANLDGDATAVSLDALPLALTEADVVVAATGAPDPVVDEATLRNAGETLLIDIAQPRDVAPAAGTVAGVEIHDLDDLQSVTDETLSARRVAAERVEAMIDEELENLLAQYKRKRADQVISAMYEGAERMKQRELRTALSKLDDGEFSDEQREVVESMADALVSQLLAAPTRSLRDAAEEDDWSTIHTALQLFDPTTGGPRQLHDTAPEELPAAVREGIPPAVLDQLGPSDD